MKKTKTKVIISVAVLLLVLTIVAFNLKRQAPNIESVELLADFCSMEYTNKLSDYPSPHFLKCDLLSGNVENSLFSVKGYDVRFACRGKDETYFCIAKRKNELYLLKVDSKAEILENVLLSQLPLAVYSFCDSAVLLYNESGNGALYLMDFALGTMEKLLENISLSDEAQNNILMSGEKILYKDIEEKWNLFSDGSTTVGDISGECVGFLNEETVLFLRNQRTLYEYNLTSGKTKLIKAFLPQDLNDCTVSDDGRFFVAAVPQRFSSPGDGLFLYVLDLSDKRYIKTDCNVDYPYMMQVLS